ncbi:uroporphyrinogen-III C-methyltransferase [Tepidimonas fonticaldi]|uniref:uroporphyrinogen-III C-methyltransferase n=1 Tax=Tepidimonas fonticaldi TaxID=1101373 RepID=A0A1A6DUH7_9BURK|nr:uroporphyrinogen-III C-methyltransferase [Tepidimonas fonticaldi]OBS30572.1 uroporphyrinogen-III C-methyltransferase [Tepidimonas fonticaldi]
MTSPTPPRGRVTLVGAGPGDPELLTIKAVRALAEADVILVDDLVPQAVLQHASPLARIVHVGKRGGCRSTPQAFIDKLMVQQAQQGLHVVRLKGGDPFIFGRAGEEIARLRAEGIPVDVVNGVTAGLAAAAALQTSLTHRHAAHGVVFVTGHPAPGQAPLDWATLGRTAHALRLTLVIYMGVASATAIQHGLLQTMRATTPVAVVHQASLPRQRHVVTTLGTLPQTLQAHALGSPAVIIVGDVLQGLAALPASQAHASPTRRAA